MSRLLEGQSAYRIYVKAPGKTRVDITDSVFGTVTLRTDQNKITYLDFNLTDVYIHSEYLKRGYEIEFYGGTVETENFYLEPRANKPNYSYLFNGTINHIFTSYPESGKPFITIKCFDYSWKRAGSTNNYLAYPSPSNPRTPEFKNSIKLSEIVSVVAKKIGANLETDIVRDTVYFDFSPAVQKNMSDWQFLKKLADDNSCYVWSEPNEGNAKIHFKDKSNLVDNVNLNRIEFVYLTRDLSNGFFQGDYLPTGDGFNESSLLRPNQIQLKSIDITESPQLAGLNITQVSDFGPNGEEQQRLVFYDETKDEIIYYELNKPLVEKLQATPEGSKRLDGILNLGAFDIPREVFMEFYIPVAIPKKSLKAIDRPYLGITVKAKAAGNIKVVPFQSYPIYGIAIYNSINNKKGTYFLKGLEFTWGSDGFNMELEFIR